MTSSTFIVRSLRFHWRSHVGVLLGATLASAILVGALAVGDSVKFSLRSMALARIGKVQLALNGRERFFRAQLADEIAAELKAPVAPVILLRGTAKAGGARSDVRTGRVQVLGVDERFWKLGGDLVAAGFMPAGRRMTTTDSISNTAATSVSRDSSRNVTLRPAGIKPAATTSTSTSRADGVVLNDRLAQKLNAKVGDDVLLRVDKPSLLSRDAPLSTVQDSSVPIRLPVAAIATDADFGRFSLEANQVPPFNAFVPLALLQQKIAQAGRANGLLVGGRAPIKDASAALWKRWQLADASLELRELNCEIVSLNESSARPLKIKQLLDLATNQLELRTDRVFLDPPIGEAALKAVPMALGVLTYFVNELRVNGQSAPYSSVAALDQIMAKMLFGVPPGFTDGHLPLADDEAIVNKWLADDLRAKAGDELKLTYFVVGPMRKLVEKSSTFRIRAIVPIAGAAADRDLFPPIPGLIDKKNCRDWEPGIPIHLERIRDKDQDYWAKYRGTPKAFITLKAGQNIWRNRFGNLTAVRYPMAGQSREAVEACLRQALNPASIGLFFTDVRAPALAASSLAMDFGGLFLGFSFFLIVAALLLTALLFAFGVEQRAEEVGTLLAVGFTPRHVQRLLLVEGGVLAFIAGVVGGCTGILYTRVVIRGLSTIWSGAVANSVLQYHVEALTIAGGAGGAFVVALFSIWIVARRQARAPARVLLNAGAESSQSMGPASNKTPGQRTAIVTLTLAVLSVIAAMFGKHEQATETFFIAGSLLLIAGIAASRALLTRMERGTSASQLTIGSLGMRNSVRRQGRSLATIGLLAAGSFMVVAVGASRHDPHEGATKRSSGTGGFALYAETTLPVYHDLNSAEGREQYGLDAKDMEGVSVVPLRVREGDEASCLNLNRAQTPRLLGVNLYALANRRAFSFASWIKPRLNHADWRLLEHWRSELAVDKGTPESGNAAGVPAIGDVNTVVWSLGKSIGDTVDSVDDRGKPFKIRIVGTIANSIVQGALLIDEGRFTNLFPSQSGYQVFLIDAPPSRANDVARTLSRALEDVGGDVTPAAERLAMFNTVENTYLSIFAVLGGLGLLLGSIGLGVVVLRNVLERRGELALMRAVGFRPNALQRLVFSEHWLLLLLGLGVGVVSAVVAVVPSMRSGSDVPWLTLAFTLLAVFVNGFVWTWAATRAALRGPLMNALRNE